MKNNIYYCGPLLFLVGCSNAIATPDTPEELISTEQIIATTNELFYDGKISIDISGDGANDSIINYSYSKLGPASTCDDTQSCTPETSSVITFYIDFPEGKSHVDFMCNSIGIYLKKSNHRRDLFCGPKTRLYWNGSKYTGELNNRKS